MPGKYREGLERNGISSEIKVPDIYNLIDEGAGTEEIVAQIIRDSYMPNHNEAVFLGIDELLRRGLEGRSALVFLAKGSDEISKVCGKISEMPNISSHELEQLLKIKRFGFMHTDCEISWSHIRSYYEHSQEKGLIGKDVSLSDYERRISIQLDRYNNQAHLEHKAGTLEKNVINISTTFGIDEPTYLELLGPREILRLRKLSQPRFLLLGSYGTYSSREIKAYADKINPDIDVATIDINPECAYQVKNDIRLRGQKNRHIVEGDASDLPFAEGCMDHIYTNRLFHSLVGRGENVKTKLDRLFGSVAMTLKPGGSFVICESAYGEYDDEDNYDTDPKKIREMNKEINHFAMKNGLIVENELPSLIAFALTLETSSSRIDDFGFPHYEDSAILLIDEGANTRFVKK